MRVAIFFAPDPKSILGSCAAAWLGRDAWTGGHVERPADLGLAGIDCDAVTASPRRYGFHGTLKAPFGLAEGTTLEQLEAALAAFAASRRSFDLPMRVAALGKFLAIVPARPNDDIGALAAAIVAQFENSRRPLTSDDVARRRKSPLSERQDELLLRYGYPYVLDQFRFHLTLTGPLGDLERAIVAPHLEGAFAEALTVPVAVDRLVLFLEDAPGAPFHVHSDHALAGAKPVEASENRGAA